MSYHLLVDISSHGFGHLAQTAPVLNALQARWPSLRLTLRSGLPSTLLQQHIAGAFTHIEQASDFGLCMHNAVDVDVPSSIQRYQDFHTQWDAHLSAYAQQIQQLQPDLLLANVSYLALAAAQQAQVPALAMCSLNWMDIFFPYVVGNQDLSEIRQQMLAAYNSASVFLRLTPGMAMPNIQHKQDIGPIARCGKRDPEKLKVSLGLDPKEKLVLVAMGGIPMLLPNTWPELPGVRWIVPAAAALPRTDMIQLESTATCFSDVLASCDCVCTKSGYGTLVEAALSATPVLYLERPNWPEESCLVAWLKQHNRAQGIQRQEFEHGLFGSKLLALLQSAPRKAPRATGIDEAVNLISARLQAC